MGGGGVGTLCSVPCGGDSPLFTVDIFFKMQHAFCMCKENESGHRLLSKSMRMSCFCWWIRECPGLLFWLKKPTVITRFPSQMRLFCFTWSTGEHVLCIAKKKPVIGRYLNRQECCVSVSFLGYLLFFFPVPKSQPVIGLLLQPMRVYLYLISHGNLLFLFLMSISQPVVGCYLSQWECLISPAVLLLGKLVVLFLWSKSKKRCYLIQWERLFTCYTRKIAHLLPRV